MDRGAAIGQLTEGAPPRVAGGVSAGCALALAISIAAVHRQVDIGVYVMGGAHVLGPHLYDTRLPHSGLLFTYPPFAALPFAPLSLLPATAAQLVWAALNNGFLVGLTAVSIRAVRPGLPRRSVVCVSSVASLPFMVLDPVLVNFQLGQVNLLIALLVMADLTGARRIGRLEVPEGLLTGIAAAIKLTPLVFIPYLLLAGKRRAAAVVAGTFVVCETLAAAVTPSSAWAYWTKYVLDSARAGGLIYISDQNLRSVLERFHHAASVPGSVLWPVTVLVGVGGVVLAAFAHRRSSPMLGILVCATTGLVVSPITWAHHLVWVVPALVWLAAAEDRPARGRTYAAAVAVLFWAAPIWWVPNQHLRELHENPWELAAGNSFFFAMSAFLVGAAALLLGRRRRSSRRQGGGCDGGTARSPSVP